MNVQNWPVDRPTPYPGNPRDISDAAVPKVASSINEFGWRQPIVVDEAGVIIAGHTRWLAAQSLGLDEVPVHVAEGLSAAQVKAYRLADNRTGEEADWNPAALSSEFDDLSSLDFDMSLTGFDPAELNALSSASGGHTDEAETPEAQDVPASRPGDVWRCGGHRVVCGDATDAKIVALALGVTKNVTEDATENAPVTEIVAPNLMLTDPPYGVNYDPDWRNRADRADGKPYGARAIGQFSNDDQIDWRGAWELFRGSVAYCWHADRHASTVQASFEAAGFEIRSQIVWAKPRFVISRGSYHWQHEPCWYAVRKGKSANWCGDRSQTTLWTIGHQKSETGHSAQKPVEVMRRPILNHTKKGESVYDPFLGSGTTVIAADTIGRVCYGIEIDPIWVDIAVSRWQNFTDESAVLEGDGRTFSEISEDRRVIMVA